MLFCHMLIFFKKSTFSKNSFRNSIRVSYRLDPDQTRHCNQPSMTALFEYSGSLACARGIHFCLSLIVIYFGIEMKRHLFIFVKTKGHGSTVCIAKALM